MDNQWGGASDNRNGRYYDEDDFYYSSRIRRFHRQSYAGFNYYDPYFTSYWYGNPSFYRPTFWQPTYFGNGFSYSAYYSNTNSLWNYRPGFATAWPYNSFAYNPYSYYGFGNSYFNSCPSYGWGNNGNFNNAFYTDQTTNNTFYSGQYNSAGGFTNNSTSTVIRRTKELNPTAAGPTGAQGADSVKPRGTESQTRSNTDPYVRDRNETERGTYRTTPTRRDTYTPTRSEQRRIERTNSAPSRGTYQTTPTRRSSSSTTRSSGSTRSNTRSTPTRSSSSSKKGGRR